VNIRCSQRRSKKPHTRSDFSNFRFCLHNCLVNHGFVASVFVVLCCAYRKVIEIFHGSEAEEHSLPDYLFAWPHLPITYVLLQFDLARPVIRLIALSGFTVWETWLSHVALRRADRIGCSAHTPIHASYWCSRLKDLLLLLIRLLLFLCSSLIYFFSVFILFHLQLSVLPSQAQPSLQSNGHLGLFLQGLKLSEREVDHSPPSSTEDKNVWSFYLHPAFYFII
jgi:hypothetical protein